MITPYLSIFEIKPKSSKFVTLHMSAVPTAFGVSGIRIGVNQLVGLDAAGFLKPNPKLVKQRRAPSW
jgi:hypothetical protein